MATESTTRGHFGASWGGFGGLFEATETQDTSADLRFIVFCLSFVSLPRSYENTAYGDRSGHKGATLEPSGKTLEVS